MKTALKQAQDNCALDVAEHLWLTSQPIKGTLGEIYLRETLGLSGALPEILGFREKTLCPVYDDYTPSLICPIYDRGAIVAVHQTFLCRETLDAWRTLDGHPVTETLGALGSGAAWLGVPDTVLGLAGTVEAALVASARFSLPVWATCEERRFESIWIPDEVEELVVFAGKDELGRDAASKAIAAFSGRCHVIVQDRP